MEMGKEPWKWGMVGVLAIAFIVFAYNAYLSVNNPENNVAPPVQDYRDSYDIEHGTTPGSGSRATPGQGTAAPAPDAGSGSAVPAATTGTGAAVAPGSGSGSAGEIDWDNMKGPGKKGP